MAESLEVVVSRLQREMEALKAENEALKAEHVELRGLLEARSPKTDLVSASHREEPQGAWRVVTRGKRKQVKPPPQIVTRNSFSALGDECEREDLKVAETALSTGKVVVVGDSQVRNIGRTFCARDSKRRICVCLPGAGIGEVGARLGSVMSGEGVAPTVCISAGGNDIGRVRNEELFRRYREALGRVRDLGGMPVLCGILPRRNAGPGWWSAARAVNCRLAEHCKRNGWLFVDNWARFYGKDYLYTRDGVHLSACGTGALAWSLEREMRAWGFFEARRG